MDWFLFMVFMVGYNQMVGVYTKQEKPLVSSLCEQTAGRLMTIHQNVKLIFWTKLSK